MNTVRIICLPIRMCSRDKNHSVILFQKHPDNGGTESREKNNALFVFERNLSPEVLFRGISAVV